MQTEVVLFDIDGTLLRTGGAGQRAFARTAALLYERPGGTDRLHFHGRTDTALAREFLAAHALPAGDSEVVEFLDAYVFLLAEELERGAGALCPGVAELLDGLRALPNPPLIGLLTGNVRLGAALKLAAHDLAAPFVFGAFGDDHGERNVVAAVARDRAARLLGRSLDGPEIVVVGDTPADIECARAINARCLAVATGGSTLPELLEHSPAWAVDSLCAVSPQRLLAAGSVPARETEWEALYEAGDTGWDLGGPAPGLSDFLAANGGLEKGVVVTPGCGRGHDTRALAEAGWSAVGLDISPSAVAIARSLTRPGLPATFQVADFLAPDPVVNGDWLFEHTLFCALPPALRDAYVAAAERTVREGGNYLSLNYLQPSGDSGPPFPVSVAELLARFDPGFELIRSWIPRSTASRAGRERMFWWRRRADSNSGRRQQL